jgi:predicted O-methyltransferase YrrM
VAVSAALEAAIAETADELAAPVTVTTMTEAEAAAWQPWIPGWSDDILPYYDAIVRDLPKGAKVVEVGVAHGRSLMFLAQRLVDLGREDVELYGVDMWPGAEFNKIRATWKGVAEKFSAADDVDVGGRMLARTRIIRRDGDAAADLFNDASLALCFIDADHSEDGMRRHLDAWTKKVAPGGILAGHDYQAQDWPGVVVAVDERFGERVQHPTRTVWEVRP